MWKRTPSTAPLIVSMAWLSGCMAAGQKLDSQAINKLEEGQTRAEVRQLFGTPKRSEIGSNGKSLDVFNVDLPRFSPVAGTRSRVNTIEVRSLHVLYSAEGKVERYLYHVGEAKFRPGPGQQWQAGAWLDQNRLSNIKRGVSGCADVVAMFGPATVHGLNVYGNEVWSWIFVEGRAGRRSTGRELAVMWDAHSLVRDYIVRDIQF